VSSPIHLLIDYTYYTPDYTYYASCGSLRAEGDVPKMYRGLGTGDALRVLNGQPGSRWPLSAASVCGFGTVCRMSAL